MKMNKVQILKKVEKIEAETSYINRCLQSRVCPECGEILMVSGSAHWFLSKYVCENKECGYTIMI